MLECGVELLTEGNQRRMGRCRNRWVLACDVTWEKIKTMAAESCKNRWCAICAWVLARKDAYRFAILLHYLKLTYHYEFLFLTLTAPNVKGDKLDEEIQHFSKSFKKLMERTEVLNVVQGYIRKMEVTYPNKEPSITPTMWYGSRKKHIKPRRKYFESLGLRIGDANPNFDTYHTHYHVLIAVNRSYFTGNRGYIKQERWLEMWREAMGDESITQVHIQKVKANGGKEIGEIAKYAAKDGDYAHSKEVFEVFYKALSGRQVTTYSGKFAEANKLYKEGKLDDYKEQDLIDYVYLLTLQWNREEGKYDEKELRELTEQEKRELRGLPKQERETDAG